MKHVVSFSGGRTSAYLVFLMEQKRINDGWDVDYVFMDTGAEHEETYKFVKDIVDHWGIDLKIIRAIPNKEYRKTFQYKVVTTEDIGWDLSLFKGYMEKYGMPMAYGSACTLHLKLNPFRNFCKDMYGSDYQTWIGIRADEPKRLTEKKGIRYLAEISNFSSSDVVSWWSKQAFNLGFDDKQSKYLGNCVFCVKKSHSRLAAATVMEDEKLKEWDEMIKSCDTTIPDKNRKSDPRDWGKFYRGDMNIIEVRNLYGSKARDIILQDIKNRSDCAIDAGESCEVFGCQIDMFEDGEI